MTKESESYRRRMLLGGVPQGADALRRIVIALAGLVGVTAIGTFGYMLIADLTFVDALYQTVFTVATVGYTELFERTVATELFTTVLIGVTAEASARDWLSRAGRRPPRAGRRCAGPHRPAWCRGT